MATEFVVMEKQIKNLKTEIETSKKNINEFEKNRDDLNQKFSQLLNEVKENKIKRDKVYGEKQCTDKDRDCHPPKFAG